MNREEKKKKISYWDNLISQSQALADIGTGMVPNMVDGVLFMLSLGLEPSKSLGSGLSFIWYALSLYYDSKFLLQKLWAFIYFFI